MRRVPVVIVLLTAAIVASGARSHASECAGEASDVAEMLSCLRGASGLQIESCPGGAPTHWSPPLAGRRILNFGERTQFGGSSRGIVFQAEPAARASAPVSGTVLYTGDFRGYGKLIVLGVCGYDVLLAGLAALSVSEGDKIEAGHALGAMPDDAPEGSPILYFEVRSQGRPIDPDAFLK